MRTLLVAVAVISLIGCGKKTEPVAASSVVTEPAKLESVKTETPPLPVSMEVLQSVEPDGGTK
jgi:predicted small lipoprotein YifL